MVVVLVRVRDARDDGDVVAGSSDCLRNLASA